MVADQQPESTDHTNPVRQRVPGSLRSLQDWESMEASERSLRDVEMEETITGATLYSPPLDYARRR